MSTPTKLTARALLTALATATAGYYQAPSAEAYDKAVKDLTEVLGQAASSDQKEVHVNTVNGYLLNLIRQEELRLNPPKEEESSSSSSSSEVDYSSN